MRTPAAVFVVLGYVVTGPTLSGRIGEPLAQAKAHSGDYDKRDGAVAPIFKTDTAGRITMECWAAPPVQWTKAQALAFGKELLPALRSVTPKALPQDGTEETFV